MKTQRASEVAQQRDQLVLEHMSLVYKIVGSMLSKLPSHIHKDDLISVGLIGLVTAASRFDPSKDVLFRTFADRHIRGAIVDELRTTDIMSRTTREKYKQIEKEIHKLEGSLGCAPDNHDIADSMGISLDAIHKLKGATNTPTFISLDDSHDSDDGTELCLGDVVCDSEQGTPSHVIAGKQIAELVYQAVNTLTHRERLMISLYYGEGLPLRDICKLLNKSESRISQLIIIAVKKLKEQFTLKGGDTEKWQKVK